MADDPIVFALANPDPEIRPEDADGLAAVIATGRSDFPNQINNVLAFPGIFRGALDVGRHHDHRGHEAGGGQGHRRAACRPTTWRPTTSCPSVFDKRVGPLVAEAVAEAAVAEGVVRGHRPPQP